MSTGKSMRGRPCVVKSMPSGFAEPSCTRVHAHTHSHTRMHIYILMYACMRALTSKNARRRVWCRAAFSPVTLRSKCSIQFWPSQCLRLFVRCTHCVCDVVWVVGHVFIPGNSCVCVGGGGAQSTPVHHPVLAQPVPHCRRRYAALYMYVVNVIPGNHCIL